MSYEQAASPKNRLLGLALVILFHIVLIYALINGLAQKIVKVVHDPLEVKIIEEVKLPPPPPPKELPPPKVDTPPPAFVPKAEVDVPAPTTTDTIAVTSTAPPAIVQPPAPHTEVRTKAALAPGCAKPVYPAESLDMEESGTVVLGFLVDVAGQVVDSKLVKSSGFARLDDAARLAFGKCKFIPATVDGVHEKSWVQQSFEWKIL